MSNKTKKQNKVVKEEEVIEEEEVVETAETIEATVEDAKNEATENAEVETESKDSETKVEVETKKELRPVAYVKNNWKKLAANALKGAALFGAGYVVGKKVMSGGEQHPSETETEVIDAEFVEKNDDVDVTTEEE